MLTLVGDRGQGVLEWSGIWLVLVALVLGLVWKLMYFPVWTVEHGLSMQILLSYITVQPLQFVLERFGPAAGIIGIVGAYLIERGRHDTTHGLDRWWNRERLAIASAAVAEALLLGVIVSIGMINIALRFLLGAVAGIVVLIGLGLYLLWTAERVAGVSMTGLGSVAFAFASVGAMLDLLTLTYFFAPMERFPDVAPSLTAAAVLLGAASLAIWIVMYMGLLRGARAVSSPISVAREA